MCYALCSGLFALLVCLFLACFAVLQGLGFGNPLCLGASLAT